MNCTTQWHFVVVSSACIKFMYYKSGVQHIQDTYEVNKQKQEEKQRFYSLTDDYVTDYKRGMIGSTLKVL